MKFTLSWLKEHLDTTAGVDEISETLTRIGLEVEELLHWMALSRHALTKLTSIRIPTICTY